MQSPYHKISKTKQENAKVSVLLFNAKYVRKFVGVLSKTFCELPLKQGFGSPVTVAKVQVTVTCHFEAGSQRIDWIKPKPAQVNPSCVP